MNFPITFLFCDEISHLCNLKSSPMTPIKGIRAMISLEVDQQSDPHKV
jgi:hypothetical protein